MEFNICFNQNVRGVKPSIFGSTNPSYLSSFLDLKYTKWVHVVLDLI